LVITLFADGTGIGRYSFRMIALELKVGREFVTNI
jgi:hypothetical protein